MTIAPGARRDAWEPSGGMRPWGRTRLIGLCLVTLAAFARFGIGPLFVSAYAMHTWLGVVLFLLWLCLATLLVLQMSGSIRPGLLGAIWFVLGWVTPFATSAGGMYVYGASFLHESSGVVVKVEHALDDGPPALMLRLDDGETVRASSVGVVDSTFGRDSGSYVDPVVGERVSFVEDRLGVVPRMAGVSSYPGVDDPRGLLRGFGLLALGLVPFALAGASALTRETSAITVLGAAEPSRPDAGRG